MRTSSQAAFTGPLLWERTLPCDGNLFQRQFMDLEEFLTENGMGCMPVGNNSSPQTLILSNSTQTTMPSQSSSPSPVSSSASSISSLSSSSSPASLLGLDVPQGSTSGMLGVPECLHGKCLCFVLSVYRNIFMKKKHPEKLGQHLDELEVTL